MDHPNGTLNSGTSAKINGPSTVADPADFDARLEAIAKKIETLQATATLQIAEQIAKAHEKFRYRRDEGGFAGWAKTRLHYTRQTAYSLLQVHKRFGGQKCQNDLDTLARSVLYVLAAPSTPEPAKAEVVERTRAGEKLRVAEVKRVVARHKGHKLTRAEARVAADGHRRLKLGDETIDAIKGTSLDRAREHAALVDLNRGAAPGEHTPAVKQLVAAAIAGKAVSAVEYVKSGAAFRGEDITSECAESKNGANNDKSPSDAALIAALNAATYWSDEAWTRALTQLPFERFLRVMPPDYVSELADASEQALRKREALYKLKTRSKFPHLEQDAPAVEQLSTSELLNVLERRSEIEQSDVADLVRKIRARIEQSRPVIELEAVPAAGNALEDFPNGLPRSVRKEKPGVVSAGQG